MDFVLSAPFPQIFLSLLIPFLLLASQKITRVLILNIGQLKRVPQRRALQIYRYFRALLYLVWLIFLLLIWGVDYQALLVVVSSVLAVVGVALVAQWSILSNLTASIIVFFTLPAKNGDSIEIIDGNNSVKGTIQEINFFNMQLEDEDGNLVSYPNNLILQKPVKKNKVKKAKEIKTLSARISNRN